MSLGRGHRGQPVRPGRRPGELKAIAGNPRGWLEAQLKAEAGSTRADGRAADHRRSVPASSSMATGLGCRPPGPKRRRASNVGAPRWRPGHPPPPAPPEPLSVGGVAVPTALGPATPPRWRPGSPPQRDRRRAAALQAAVAAVQPFHRIGRQARDHRADAAGVRTRDVRAPSRLPRALRGHAAGLLRRPGHIGTTSTTTCRSAPTRRSPTIRSTCRPICTSQIKGLNENLRAGTPGAAHAGGPQRLHPRPTSPGAGPR